MQTLKFSHCFICDERSPSLRHDTWMTHINNLYAQAETIVDLQWEDCRMCRPLGSPEKTMCRVHVNWNDKDHKGVLPHG